ncbi:MAG: porin family protein, partial [Pseudomonadota bacterium]
LDNPEGDDDIELNQAGLHLGIAPTDWFALELRYGSSFGDDHTEGNTSYEIDRSSGAYALWSVPLSKYLNSPIPIKPYIATGVTQFKLDRSPADTSIDQSHSGFSYGVGLGYDVLDNVNTSIEYMNYIDRDEFSADGVNFKLSYKF